MERTNIHNPSKTELAAPPVGGGIEQPAAGMVVTFLFTAIEGAARMWERQPEEMHHTLSRYETIMGAVIEASGGHVFQTIGDAVCVAFTRADDALVAAIAGQRALEATMASQLKVKMALHSGEAVRRQQDYFAPHTLNRLSRILTVAHGGQILVSATTRELLGEQLLTESELRDLGERRLRDVPEPERIYQAIVPDLPQQFPPLETLDRRPSNLPAQPNLLIGRNAEVREVSSLLRQPDARLVTLTGPGGTGKTRLSLQVASAMLDEFAAGCYFVSLAPISEPELVMDAIAAALNIREASGKSLRDTVIATMGEQEMLLVLDNFEQIVAAAPIVAELLAATSRLKVLTTSREALHLEGEYEYAVQPLRLPDLKHLPEPDQLADYEAVALFLARARAVKFDFQLSAQNAAAVAEICTRLDGLPLAIELAAAQVQLLEPRAMLTRLANRLALLTRGMRNLPPRQQTLRGAIDWSYTLLSDAEQQLFRRLAVFAGGWTLEAAAQVCNPDGNLDVQHRLTQLVYKSLVRQSLFPDSEVGSEGGKRYSMLETIREYALDKLTTSSELEATQAVHADYYLNLAEQGEPELRGANQAEWLTRLEQEHDNLRAAIAFDLAHDPANAVRLAGALWRFWEMHGHLSEGRNMLATVLSKSDAADPIYKANALNGAGNLAFLQGDYSAAVHFHEQALSMRREVGDKPGIASSLNNLGNIASEQGDYATASKFYSESLTFAREVAEKGTIAATLYNLGIALHLQGDYTGAQALYEESLGIWRQSQDRWNSAGAILNLGLIAIHQNNYAQARKFYEETLSISEQLNNKVGIADALDGLGLVAYCQGDYQAAEQLYTTVKTLSQELGYEIREASSLLLLGNTARMKGDYSAAIGLVQNALTMFWKLRDQAGVVGSLISLGIAVYREGKEQNIRCAVRLLSSGTALIEFIAWLAIERAEYDRAVQQCRARLGEAAFEKAWDEGAAVSIAEAVEYALALSAH